jgi:hypothetical protein
MQFYVHDGDHKLVVDKKFADGSFSMAITTNGAAPTSNGKTTNAIGRTDKIENVMWATLTKAEKLQTPYKEATLKFNAKVNEGAPIVGQDYIVKVSYPAIGGVGIEGFTTKVATAYASAGATTATIVAELVENLNAAFEADGVLEAKVGKTEAELVITQTNIAEKSYERGVRPVTIADFNVIAAPVIEDGEEVEWLDVTIAPSTTAFVKDGYKLADMEYFALGERGDEYRMMGYPNYVKTTYRINPAEEYDVYNIHYAYKGSNDQSHKSEKDLIIAVPADTTITGLDAALSALGVTLKVIAKE